MIYDHPKDNGPNEICEWIWVQADLGLICTAEVHLILGTWFNYPPCCITAFIFGEPGDLATCDRLGTYYHCRKCYETKKVKKVLDNLETI